MAEQIIRPRNFTDTATDSDLQNADNYLWLDTANKAKKMPITKLAVVGDTAATEADLVAGSTLPIMTANGPKSLPGNTIAKASEQAALSTYAQNVAHSIAPEFDPTRTSENPYKAGESVTYTDGKQYAFIKPHYGPWSSSDVVATNVDAIYLKNYQFLRNSEKRTLAGYSFKSSIVDGVIYQSDASKILYVPIKAGQAFEATYRGETSGRFNVGYSTEEPALGIYPTILYETTDGADGDKFRTIAPVDCYMLVTVGAEKDAVISTSLDILEVEGIAIDTLVAQSEVDSSDATHKLISSSTGKWTMTTNTYAKCVEVPAHCSSMYVLPSSLMSYGARLAFLKDLSGDAGDTPNYCAGYSNAFDVNGFRVIQLPEDCKFVYFVLGYYEDGVYTAMPRSIIFNKENYAELVKVDDSNIESKNVMDALVEVKADATGRSITIEVVEPDLALSTVPFCITTAGDWRSRDASLSSRITVDGYNFVSITTQENITCRITFAKKAMPAVDMDKQDLIDGGYLCDDTAYIYFEKNTTTEVPIPSDAVYVYVILRAISGLDLTPDDFKLEKNYIPAPRNVDGVDMLARSKTHVMPELHKGTINSSGVVDDSADNRMFSDRIFYPFYVKTCEGFEIDRVCLFDVDGKLLCYNFVDDQLPPDVVDRQSNYSGETPNRSFFGNMNLSGDNLSCRVVFKKTDDSNIDTEDNVIDLFGWVDSPDLVMQEVDNVGYLPAIKRALSLQRIAWTPKKNVPISSAYTGIKCLANNTYIGIPYSSVKETQKYVGFNVSLRTFMTALSNKRSLIYTENVDGSSSASGYGYTWHGVGTTMSYYGIVCSNFVSYVLGLKKQYFTDDWGYIPGMTEITGVTAANIQPMTSLTNAHHTFMVIAVYNDKFGNRKLVVVAESTVALCLMTAYTVERFQERLDSEAHKFWRYDNLADNAGWISRYEGDRDFVCVEPEQFPKKYKYNLDICTFAGDYASFATGDDIYLNAVPGDSYNAIDIYKDDVLSETIDISSLTPNTDGYVDVNVTTYTSGYGKYKARLTDGNGVYSDYCYFERLDAQLSISGNVVSFSSANGTPVMVGIKAGIAYNLKPQYDLTPEQIASGQVTVDASAVVSGRYVAMLVQGDYGQPCRVVQIE